MATQPGIFGALAASVTDLQTVTCIMCFLKVKRWESGSWGWLVGYFGRCVTVATQAGGGSFVPDGTLDKETCEPSDQSLGYFLSTSGLDGGSPASEGSVAGFGETGLLAANGSVTFPAFIFKNALAAYIRKGSRLKVSGFRGQGADRQRDVQVRDV